MLSQQHDVTTPSPPPTPVRWVQPNEQLALIDECMIEAGWVPKSKGHYSFNEEVADSFHDAYYQCASRFPVDVTFTGPLTAEDLQRSYDYMVNEHHPCLEGLGFNLPPLGSKEAYLQNPEAGAEFADAVEAQTVQLVQAGKLASPDEVYDRCPRQNPSALRGIDD